MKTQQHAGWTPAASAGQAALAVLLVLSPLAMSSARAGSSVTSADLIGGFDSAQDNITNAALKYRQASPDEARNLLEAASADLTGVQTGMHDPAIAAMMGRNLNALNNKIAVCLNAIDAVELWVDPAPGTKAKTTTAVLNKLFATATMVRTSEQMITRPLMAGMMGANVLGTPLIMAQGNPLAYKAGQLVAFRIYPTGFPDPAAQFTTQPTVSITNNGSVTALDPTYQVWAAGNGGRYYTLTLRMGPQEGTASFAVSYNGQTSAMLVYNHGAAGAATLPMGYPTTMSKGNYQMSMTVTGTQWFTDANGLHTSNIAYGPVLMTSMMTLTSPAGFFNNMMKSSYGMMQTGGVGPYGVLQGSGGNYGMMGGNGGTNGMMGGNGGAPGMMWGAGGTYGMTGAVTTTASDANGFTLMYQLSYGNATQGSEQTVVLTITKA